MNEQHRAAPLSARERAVLRRIETELWPGAQPNDASLPGSGPGAPLGRPAWAFQLLGVVCTTFAAVVLGVLVMSAGNWRAIAVELGMVSLAFAVGLVLTLDPLRRRAGSAVISVGSRLVAGRGLRRLRRRDLAGSSSTTS